MHSTATLTLPPSSSHATLLQNTVIPGVCRATMASSSVVLAYAWCALLCICSLQTVVMESLHLQFYTHETRGGPNGTILISAGAGAGGNFSSLGWGSFVVFDNVIKAGFASNSTLLGQVTGSTVLTTKAGWPVQFLAQMIFNENYKYNGSSFTVIPGGIIFGSTGYLQNFTGYGQPVEVTTNPPDSGLHVYLWNVYLESK